MFATHAYILNMRQIHYQLDVKPAFEKNRWEQTMEIEARQGKFFKYDKQLVGIESWK